MFIQSRKKRKSSNASVASLRDENSESASANLAGKRGKQGEEKSEVQVVGGRASFAPLSGRKSGGNEFLLKDLEDFRKKDRNCAQFDLKALYKKFTNNDETNFLTNQRLKKQMQAMHPIKTEKGTDKVIFILYVWRKVLKNMFLKKNSAPTESVRDAMLGVVIETMNYKQDDLFFEQTLIGSYIEEVNGNENALADENRSNWYDLPAIIRCVAPTNNVIEDLDVAKSKNWMQAVLRGLPNSVIMAPFDVLNLSEYLQGVGCNRIRVSFI